MKSIRDKSAQGESRLGKLAVVLAAGAGLGVGAMSFAPALAAQDATAAVAPPGPPGARWGHGEPMGPMHLYAKLGLSADQQASIKAIVTAAKPRMKSLHDQMRANQLKEMQTKPDDPNYGNVVAEVSQSNATLAAQRTTLQSDLRTQMYAVLTPAQKTQLATLEAQLAAKPHHPRWGGPQGPGAGAPPEG
jgi:Spy/CpxP family protein refolding chaperone